MATQESDKQPLVEAERPKQIGHGKWVTNKKEVILNAVKEAVVKHSALKCPGDAPSSGDSWKAIKKQMQLWSKDTVVFVMRAGPGPDVAVDADLTVVHQPSMCVAPWAKSDLPAGIDGFPGASVVYPVSTNQWASGLVWFVISAFLRGSGLLTEMLINLDIINTLTGIVAIDSRAYPTTPLWCQKTFVICSGVCMVLSVAIAMRRAHEELTKHEAWTGASCAEKLTVFAPKVAMRWFGASHFVLNAAPDMFVAGTRLGLPDVVAYPEMPLMINMSRRERKYNMNSGFITMLPKVILEDCIMATLKVAFAIFESGGSDVAAVLRHPTLVFALLSTTLLSLSSMIRARDYLSAVLDFDEELVDLAANQTFDVAGRLNNLPFKCLRECTRNRLCLRACLGCQKINKDRRMDGNEARYLFAEGVSQVATAAAGLPR